MKMRYKRVSFEVEAIPYQPNKGIEDGFELWRNVVVNGWINTEDLVKITKDDGKVVCPYINSRRGRLFIAEDDYIVIESDGSRYVCTKDKFVRRFEEVK